MGMNATLAAAATRAAAPLAGTAPWYHAPRAELLAPLSDKHAALLAENQFAIATLLDPHYTDLAYVRDTKHWPPSLVDSLHDFITLS